MMNSLERVLATLSHKEPDRVPLFLLLTLHGAKELGLSIKDYFSKGENVAQGQLKLLEKYGHDCLYSFFYAAVETEAFGGGVVYREDTPPVAGEPIIRNLDNIKNLAVPKIENSPSLLKVLDCISILKKETTGNIPIIGVVMSPFSLPVMQMGFDKYIELIFRHQDDFHHLMKMNEKFTISWANAQLEAGATAITYFDPVSSTSILPKGKYEETGLPISQRVIKQIKGPTAIHMASGLCNTILDNLSTTSSPIVGVSTFEDLKTLKTQSQGKLTLLGNLNGIKMRRWTEEEAELEVKNCIQAAAAGGGFILSDNHGEIPIQVPEKTLLAITKAVKKWGTYPINLD